MQKAEKKLRIIMEIWGYRENVILYAAGDGLFKNCFQLFFAV